MHEEVWAAILDGTQVVRAQRCRSLLEDIHRRQDGNNNADFEARHDRHHQVPWFRETTTDEEERDQASEKKRKEAKQKRQDLKQKEKDKKPDDDKPDDGKNGGSGASTAMNTGQKKQPLQQIISAAASQPE